MTWALLTFPAAGAWRGMKTADKFCASQTAAWHNTAQAPSSCGVSAPQWLLYTQSSITN